MLARFDEDTHTLPGHGVRSAQLATWEKVHHRWHPDEPVLPLTWEKIRAVAAHFKEAGYRSWSNYASRIKEEHVVAGYPWTLLLETCFRKAKRSVLRGIGPTKQSTPVGIIAVAGLDPDDIIETPAMPVNIKEIYIVISFFMLREIEAAALLWRHVDVVEATETVTLNLSISKVDFTAVGCRRSWGCVCVRVPRGEEPCPFHAFLRHRAELSSRGSSWVSSDAPLFPNSFGEHPTKAAFVAGFRSLAAAAGTRPGRNQGEVGGHSPRVEGAQYLAALGLELAVIQLMARHSSATIMTYVREAPLIAITGLTKAKAAARADHDASVVQSWSDSHVRRQLKTLHDQVAMMRQVQVQLKGVRITEDLAEHGDAADPTTRPLDSLKAVLNLENMKAHIVKVGADESTNKSLWRTRCPWLFYGASVRLCTASQVLADPALRANLCRRCWRGIDTDVASSESED